MHGSSIALTNASQCRQHAYHGFFGFERPCVAGRFVLRDVKSFVEKQPGAWAPSRIFTAGSRQATARTLQDKLEEFLKELQVRRLAPPSPPPPTPPLSPPSTNPTASLGQSAAAHQS